METAASHRVNTDRHADVSHIPMEMLNTWAKEYLDSKQLSALNLNIVLNIENSFTGQQ